MTKFIANAMPVYERWHLIVGGFLSAGVKACLIGLSRLAPSQYQMASQLHS